MADVIEKTIGVLRGDAAISLLLNEVEPIGYMAVPQGTPPPYVLVSDITNNDNYGMDDSVTHSDVIIDIEVVSELETTTGSGYTITKAILKRIHELFQNQEAGFVTEEGTAICLRQGKKLSTRIITQSGGEQYLRRGHEWLIVVSP